MLDVETEVRVCVSAEIRGVCRGGLHFATWSWYTTQKREMGVTGLSKHIAISEGRAGVCMGPFEGLRSRRGAFENGEKVMLGGSRGRRTAVSLMLVCVCHILAMRG